MSATKVVLIVLALIVVLFVVLVVITPRDGATQSASDFSSGDHPTLASMNGVLGHFAPKLSAKDLFPAVRSFDLSIQPEYDETILPNKSQKFRLLNFTANPTKHCARVLYTPSDPNDFDKKQSQKSEDSGSEKHPQAFSFTVFQGGGTLKITRASPFDKSRCVVSLEVAQ